VIIIAGTITIAPERRADLLAACEPFQRSAREDEAGCLAYVFSADPLEPGQIAVYERWTDAESLDAHFLHPNYLEMVNLFVVHRITGFDVRKFRIDADAPVYNAQRKATASFDE
jgi:quinol monooxygenase YgiN